MRLIAVLGRTLKDYRRSFCTRFVVGVETNTNFKTAASCAAHDHTRGRSVRLT